MAPAGPDERDEAIAAHIVERIPDGATLQIGVGGVPNAVLELPARPPRSRHPHRGARPTGHGPRRARGGDRHPQAAAPHKVGATFALGTQRLYDWLDLDAAVEMLPVDWSTTRGVIARERDFVSINATTEVDLYGQCASETIAGRYWSSSGGQADFARGAMYCRGRPGLHRAALGHRGPQPDPRTPDRGFGGHHAEEHRGPRGDRMGHRLLRGRPLAERARSLIAIAHPDHRDALESEAREASVLRAEWRPWPRLTSCAWRRARRAAGAAGEAVGHRGVVGLDLLAAVADGVHERVGYGLGTGGRRVQLIELRALDSLCDLGDLRARRSKAASRPRSRVT